MKKLTADDLKNLKFGEKVYRFYGIEHRGLNYVGRMPGCENYLIFADGEHLEHLYISSKNDEFRGDWYGGQYNSEFVGKLLIEKYQEKIKSVKRIYLKEDETPAQLPDDYKNPNNYKENDFSTWENIFEFQARKYGANYSLLKEWLMQYCEVPQFIKLKEKI